MKLKNAGAEFYVPDSKPIDEAVSRTTHLAISAHQDDIEIMAYDGIGQCFGRNDKWFMAVVATNGAGSPRSGLYADHTDEQMRQVRKVEQKKAAFVGEYSALALLDYSSLEVKDSSNVNVVQEIKDIILAARPTVIYTHNLADKHDTHVSTAVKVIKALRELPGEALPERVYGCECWRNLDWVNDNEKVLFDVSTHSNIAAAVLEVFDSQICGGKRYDLATAGRRLGNATFSASHGVDEASAVSYAMDLTPLIKDKALDICTYVTEYIDRFKADVRLRLSTYGG
jgi:LmbE family N-acetylglucosaminyl deacetylase